MSKYKDAFIEDFVFRTNHSIQNYSGDYDATVLLNGMLGILVVPFEKNLVNTNTYSKLQNFFERLKEEQKYRDYGYYYSTEKIIRHLRNAIAHFHIGYSSSKNLVTGFIFTNYAVNKTCELTGEECHFKNEQINNSQKVFQLELSINDIKEFAEIISNDISVEQE